MQEGFILPTSEIYKFYQGKEHRETTDILPNTADQLPNYKFLHDRIQQAAYSLNKPEGSRLFCNIADRLRAIESPHCTCTQVSVG